MAFLRKKLYGKPAEGEGQGSEKAKGGGGVGQGLFCYVNSVFAPGLDEGVGNLWRVSPPSFPGSCLSKGRDILSMWKLKLMPFVQCFKTDDQLIVGYSVTPAFG